MTPKAGHKFQVSCSRIRSLRIWDSQILCRLNIKNCLCVFRAWAFSPKNVWPFITKFSSFFLFYVFHCPIKNWFSSSLLPVGWLARDALDNNKISTIIKYFYGSSRDRNSSLVCSLHRHKRKILSAMFVLASVAACVKKRVSRTSATFFPSSVDGEKRKMIKATQTAGPRVVSDNSNKKKCF